MGTTEGRSRRGCSHSARNFDVDVVAFIHGVQTKSSGTINTLIADLFRRWTIRGLWVEDNISGESGEVPRPRPAPNHLVPLC